jgi:pimeloyl-ACP methyl ester carboxylesterase
LVGHDWGAAVAWAVAEFFPDYVTKLAALQVPPPAVWAANMTWRQAAASWYMLFFQLPRLPELWLGANDFAQLARTFRATARPGTFSDSDIALYKESLRRADAATGATALTGGVNYYRASFPMIWQNFVAYLKGGRSSVAPRVRVPTLFVYGERDAFLLPATARGVAAYVAAPYSEVRFARAGHWVQQEYPNEVNAALLSFLKDDEAEEKRGTGNGEGAKGTTD